MGPSTTSIFDVDYDVSDGDNDLSPASLCEIHYDPTQVDVELGNTYDDELHGRRVPTRPFTATIAQAEAVDDGDPATTDMVSVATYFDLDETPVFPDRRVSCLPASFVSSR